MELKKVLGVALMLAFTFAGKAWAFDHSHAAWTALLKKYQAADGFIRYKEWKADQGDLDKYLKSLEAVTMKDYEGFTPDQRKAFLINAYNAFTVKFILKHYPVKSIKDIGGFFTKPWGIEFFSLLDGRIKSLDPIEHDWLRKKPELKDPRVHAAVNCASWSCPALRNEAFVAERLDEQLTDSTRRWLADPSRNKFDPAKKKAYLSKIFDWFEEDFGDSDAKVAEWVKQYGPPEASEALSGKFDIDYLDYDWKLNEAGGSGER